MGDDSAHVRLTLDTDEPISLSDFVGTFVGIESQFEKFIAAQRPDLRGESEFFVKEVRKGSIEADLIVLAAISAGAGFPELPGLIDALDKTQILTKFVGDLRDRIAPYFIRGGRDPKASKSDLSDFYKVVSAMVRDPKGRMNLETAVYEDGKRDVRAAFKFSSSDARTAQGEISEHRRELEAKSDSDYERVLLRFVRPSVEKGKPGKKGGERGVIEKLHKRALPIVYASDLAEQRIRHEKLQVEGNVFRTLFDVDVNVELNANGKPLAYNHACIAK
ncbi:hypothetical protein [Sphingomonas kyeonggiensis]|uniref:Uncharacterized protein n=1 Tax=Sphingomonas kyeonggiensis TaxID=1268553 RepID=A0A7W6JR64_9SPHN|nr:hypothetical protein [Sphingomonas kyeonggiensis]MBB4096977.1 hypothetical protein [Sphingomonas kyeonggiensis]